MVQEIMSDADFRRMEAVVDKKGRKDKPAVPRATYGDPAPDTSGHDALNRLNRSNGERVNFTRPTGMMTERQYDYIKSLLGRLATHNPDVHGPACEWFDRQENLTKANASEVIDRLKKHLDTPASSTKDGVWTQWRAVAKPLAEMGGQHGARFAIHTADGSGNDLSFWEIVGDNGRYFLHQVIGGQGAVRVRMSPEAMVAIARRIADDAKEAMLRYGREIGECGHCHRKLTKKVSRDAGIGPVCARGKGW